MIKVTRSLFDKQDKDPTHIFTLRRHGYTLSSVPKITKEHKMPARDKNKGWTKNTALRNSRFLQSVEYDKMSESYEMAINFTWTIKDLVDNPETFHYKLELMKKQLKSFTVDFAWHWVIEWQERGVPHIHGVVFANCDTPLNYMKIQHSLKYDFCKHFHGSLPVAQHSTLISDAVGWAKYTAKHASRGINHYQRSSFNIPKSWKKSTGRVWGKTLNFITFDEKKFYIPRQIFFDVRRSLNKIAFSLATTKYQKRYIKKRLNSYFKPTKDSVTMYECKILGNFNKALMSVSKSQSDWLDYSLLSKILDFHINQRFQTS